MTSGGRSSSAFVPLRASDGAMATSGPPAAGGERGIGGVEQLVERRRPRQRQVGGQDEDAVAPSPIARAAAPHDEALVEALAILDALRRSSGTCPRPLGEPRPTTSGPG